MQRTILAVSVSVGLGLAGGCSSTSSSITGTTTGSGHLASETREVAGFQTVAVSGAGRLIIEQTGVESLEITAEENLLPLIRSDVVGGQLILGFQPGVGINSTREVLYRLTVAELVGVEASGASSVEIQGLSTPALGTVLSGASSMIASGAADTHGLVLSGASRCEAPDLRSRVVTATVSGASYGLFRVDDTLAATVSGASLVEYYGDPVVSASISGGSSVSRVGP